MVEVVPGDRHGVRGKGQGGLAEKACLWSERKSLD